MSSEIEQQLLAKKTWDSIDIDDRIKKAITRLKWSTPAVIQAEVIPLAFQGKDILAKARTGSGKTGAFAIPVLQRILREKETVGAAQGVRAIVLVPTSELAHQTRNTFQDLSHYCSKIINILQLAADEPFESQLSRLGEVPDIIVATPGRLVAHLKQENIDLSHMEMLVIDEADLVMSYGYKEDLEKIKLHLPAVSQAFLMSATLSQEVMELRHLVLHSPALVELEETEEKEGLNQNKLQQYAIQITSTNEDDKYLVIFVMLKLDLVKGKTIIFVNNVDACFRLKLFFERFSIPAAVLNEELPLNSRQHIMDQFNKGIFDLLITSDQKKPPQEPPSNNNNQNETKEDDKDENEKEDEGEEDKKDDSSDDEEGDTEDSNDDDEKMKDQKPQKSPKSILKSPKSPKQPQQQQDSGFFTVARGIDFKKVTNVINFDFPPTVDDYIHRVGRTARAGHSGNSLSFVCPEHSEIFTKVLERQNAEGREILPYKFKMSIIEGFRYRVEDQLHSISRLAVKEARLLELKKEMLNSQKLKTHFEENPRDMDAVLQRHDKELQSHKVKRHLKTIPYYLIPSFKDLQDATTLEDEYQQDDEPGGNIRVEYNVRNLKKKFKKDPLKSFEYHGRGKKRSHDEATSTDSKDDNKQQRDSRKKFRRHKRKPKRIDKVPKNTFKSSKPKPY